MSVFRELNPLVVIVSIYLGVGLLQLFAIWMFRRDGESPDAETAAIVILAWPILWVWSLVLLKDGRVAHVDLDRAEVIEKAKNRPWAVVRLIVSLLAVFILLGVGFYWYWVLG